MKISASSELALVQLTRGLSFDTVMTAALQVPPLGHRQNISRHTPCKEIVSTIGRKQGIKVYIPRNGLIAGAKVFHPIHGTGTVLEEWGSWMSCRECYAEIMEGMSCGCGGELIRVSGKGIFLVKFKDGARAINRAWLKF